jgi:tetratricopeptide (TPR) repeat protein
MRSIRIREQGAADGDGRFEVVVAYEGGGEHAVSVGDPLAGDERRQRLVAWYFEEHLRYPFLDHDRKAEAEDLLRRYGESLFSDLFGSDRECGSEFRQIKNRGLDGWRVEVTGSSTFQGLRWETIRAPADWGVGTPLGVVMPVVRRVADLAAGFDPEPTGTALNVLVVTARPNGPSDVGYRTISRPLFAALRQARVAVNVDFVRPGTWSALVGRLRETSEAHGSGWYQVVHFDVHGAVATGRELAAAEGDRYRFADVAAGGIAGEAFLFFETDEQGRAEPVSTARVADVLVEHRVPVAVLNACQSAMQPGESEASLAQRLVEAGVPVSVGMAYSVTVSAAERMMPVVYDRLAGGADVVAAVRDGRRALYDERARRVYFDQDLDLEDWMLPVVFAQRDVQLSPRTPTAAEAAELWERRGSRVEEPRPRYGFVGRDLDVQAIERRLLHAADCNELLVRGMAGAGKSTLLEHLGWWWQATGLIDRVFSFSYEERAWTAGQIVHAIAGELLGVHELAAFQALSEDAQLERVAALLRAQRHAIVLDNAESITATPASIPHALDEPGQQRLKLLLAKLRGGRTLVLIGSRSPEDWVAAESFGANVHPLGGLDPQAASILVDRIFADHGISHPETEGERAALAKIERVLGRYPLMFNVVLPTLASAPPSQILAELTVGGRGADPVGMVQRAIEISHGRLDPATRNALLTLAPFTGVLHTAALAVYAQLGDGYSEVSALGPRDLPGAVEEAVRVGLAAHDANLPGLVRLQPVLPYFLRTQLAGRPGLAHALAAAHHDHYQQLAGALHELLIARDAKARSTGQYLIAAEYPNLSAALGHAIQHGLPVIRLVVALEEYLDQTKQQKPRRELLERAIEGVEGSDGRVDVLQLVVLHNLAGVAALEQHRLPAAHLHHTAELALHESLGERRGRGVTYHQLGRVAQEQRRFDEAEGHYRQALELFLEFDDRYETGDTYHQLGTVAHEQRHFDEAGGHYRQALEIFLEFDDRRHAASSYHQLGMVAQQQRHFDEAEGHYRHALEIFLEFDDRHRAASSYHQLGIVAQQQRQFDEAEGHYRHALEIFLGFDDRHHAASSYHQLGILAHKQERFDEAEGHYLRALEIDLEFDDRHHAASSYHQLGIVAQQRRQFDEAEGHYRRALELFLAFDDRYETGDTYHQLGTVAQDKGHLDQAEEHYRQALELFLEFDDRHRAATSYHQLGVVAHKQERFDEAEGHYRTALEIKLEFDDRYGVATTHSRLGILLTETERSEEAVEHSLAALVVRRDTDGGWSRRDLAWLKRQRRLIGDERFRAAVVAAASDDELVGTLESLLERVDEPE